MNIERFHNELAMRLGYERIVKDKRISISVEESDDPCVILTVQGGDDKIRFNASDISDLGIKNRSYLYDEIAAIVDAVHHAYIDSTKERFFCYNK